MSGTHPNIIVIAGPNGAGKTTTAPSLLRDSLKVDEFVNADTIALGLSGFQPEKAAIQAGRVMLARLHQLAAEKADFAFETTLSSRNFAPWISTLKRDFGYRFRLVFLWLSSADLAVERVAERVLLGGHNVPEAVVRRRYEAGLTNFFELYHGLAATWRFYDNSIRHFPRLIASGNGNSRPEVHDKKIWEKIQGGFK
jgi:predicted ABC-type ATPase